MSTNYEKKMAYKKQWHKNKMETDPAYREKMRLRGARWNAKKREGKIYVPKVDFTGQVFGQLTVLKKINVTGKAVYLCKCSCGNECEVKGGHLQSRQTKSCGCLLREQRNNLSHGKSRTKEYVAWVQMKSRCYNKNTTNYDYWGGRGVIVCDRWKESFENFIEDMGYMPSARLSLERVDVNGNYEPSNCIWATFKQQSRNKRSTTNYKHKGEVRSLKEWSEELNIPYDLLHGRVARQGWTIEEVVSSRKGDRFSKKNRSKLRLTVDEIINLHKQGMTPPEISERANCVPCYISRLLRENGIRIRTPRKYFTTGTVLNAAISD